MSLAELFYATHPRRASSLRSRTRGTRARRRKILFEPLEPRLLLNAQPLALAAATAADLSIHIADDNGTPTIQIVDDNAPNAASRVLASQALADTSSVHIQGSDQNDTLTIDARVVASGVPIDFVGGSGTDTLAGPPVDSTWHIIGANAGTVGNVTFSGVENLTGAPDNQDTFVVAAGGSVGAIEGGAGGFDTIRIEAGGYALRTYTGTGPHSGSIDLDGTVIQYSGVEPIADSDPGGAIVFNLPDTGNPDVTLTSSSASDFLLSGSTFESTPFTVTGATTSVTINLGSGDDTITLSGLSGTNIDGKLTIAGEDGNDAFKLDDDWGVGVAIAETAGHGTDTLDFGPYSDTGASRDAITITPDVSGNLTISGKNGSTLTLTSTSADNVENLTNANIDLTGSAKDALVGGLSAMATFARNVAQVGELATSLPLIGKNAEVTVAKALDFAEAVDELRFQVQQFFADHATVTTDTLIADLNTLLHGLTPESLAHLGPAVLSPLAISDPSIAASDVFEFHVGLDSHTVTVKVDVDASPAPNVVGDAVTVGFNPKGGADDNVLEASELTVARLVDALNAGLGALGTTSGKVAAVARNGRIAFDVIDTSVGTLSVEGAQQAISKRGFVAGVPVTLNLQLDADPDQDILRDLGSLLRSVASPISLGVVLANGTPQLRFDVDYRAERTSQFFYNLGDEAQSLGLAFDLQAKIEAKASAAFDFKLGLALSPASAQFFLDVDQLRAGIHTSAAAESVSNLGLNVGFLSATASGTLSLDAGVVATLSDT